VLAGLSLDPLYKAIGWLLAFFYALPPHSLGLSIILMTLVVMLIQLPFIAKSTRSQILMQRVQPEIKKIQAKYKDDRQKQNEELLKFYQENNINPISGCLPMLLVLPIGMAVFRSFHQGAILVKDKAGQVHVNFAGRGLQGHIPRTGAFSRLYTDLCGAGKSVEACSLALKTKPPPHVYYFLGVNLNWSAREVSSKLPGEFFQWLPYYFLIALVIFTGWYQVHQTQARQLRQGGPAPPAQMQVITKIMPVMFGLITFTLNAATTLYFVVSNLWRVGQQHFVLNKMYEQEGLLGGTPKALPPKTDVADGPGKTNGTKSGASPGSKSQGAAGTPPNPARRKKKKKR
jgi:YidC/Oxa1 family membrane protein insertase